MFILVKMRYLAMDGTGLSILKKLKYYDPYPHQIATYEAMAKIIYPLPLWERDRMRGRACSRTVGTYR